MCHRHQHVCAELLAISYLFTLITPTHTHTPCIYTANFRNMWLDLRANFQPKSVNSLVLVVIYCLLFTVNLCHSSENVTAAIVPNAQRSLVIGNVTQWSHSEQILTNTSAMVTATTTTAPAAAILVGDSTLATTTTTTTIAAVPSKSDILKILTSTIRPPNIKLDTNSTGINAAKSVSGIPSAADKPNAGGRVPKPKNKQQMNEQKQLQKQQQQQKQSHSKIESWPSKPTGTHKIEGNFEHDSS